MPETLPAGETLPQYDDQHPEGVDMDEMYAWLKARRGWGNGEISLTGFTAHNTVRDVLAALQAVGDATLVKNGTYRLMRRDGADIERLAAWQTRNGLTAQLVEHNGNPVDTAITTLTAAQALTRKVADLFGKMWAAATGDK